MYKVFVNDKPIIITDCRQKDKSYPVYFFEEIIVYKLKKGSIDSIYLFSSNLEATWNWFKANFKLIKAADGLALNLKKYFLFVEISR